MSKVRIYRIDTESIWSWRVVVFSLFITLIVFICLPLIESLVNKTKRLVVRQVESIEIQKALPRMPPPIEKKKAPPKPKLNQARQRLAMMKLNAALDLQPGIGDFGLNFGLRTMTRAEEIVFDIAEVDKAPKVIYQVPPVYPLAAKYRGIEGKVVIKFIVQVDGSVDGIQVESATPANLFEQSATTAVKKWRFKPGRRHDQPVATRVELPIEFKLER